MQQHLLLHYNHVVMDVADRDEARQKWGFTILGLHRIFLYFPTALDFYSSKEFIWFFKLGLTGCYICLYYWVIHNYLITK